MRRVALALVEHEGRILIARRRAGTTFGGLWELPGGGCREGEAPADCAAREVLEETGLRVRVERAAARLVHAYPEFTVELHAFFCSVLEGEAQPLASDAVAWVTREELAAREFPPANRALFAQAFLNEETGEAPPES
jgi:mutator protein MutT